MVCVVRWKAEDELLKNQVSEAEHLGKDWSVYENDRKEVEMSINKLESALDAVVADTDAEHLQTCLDHLQVCTQYCDQLNLHSIVV